MPHELRNTPSALEGLKVIEFAGLAPGPFAGMILADFGAQVTKIDRIDSPIAADVLSRGKRSIGVNPKSSNGIRILKRLINQADVLVDPFRPGVMERLGLGPEEFLGEAGSNPRLVYARIVGFDRQGKHGNMAGHDLNYLAQSGVLSMLPPTNSSGRPSFPINILADMAGGGLTCVLGILLALLERQRSGRGQVVDNDMVSGTRYVSSWSLVHDSIPGDLLSKRPAGQNPLDGGSPFYNTYQCKDGKWMSLGCLEPKFFATFLTIFLKSLPSDFTGPIGTHPPRVEEQLDGSTWENMQKYFAAGFLTRTRDDWGAIFHGTDACAVAVITPTEAAVIAGSSQPTPHPHLSRTPGNNPGTSCVTVTPYEHTKEVLEGLGITPAELSILEGEGVIRLKKPKFAKL